MGTYAKIVTVVGSETSNAIEMKGEETLGKLLKYAGGFASDAYKKNVNVSRKGDSEFQMYTVYNEDFDNFKLANGDSIMIRFYRE